MSDLETESKTNLVSAINKAAQSGLSDMVKQALLVCFDHVAWGNDNGQNYYDALESALYPQGDLEVISISATYTQSGNVYPDTGLESLKDDLVVTAHYDNSSTQILHKNFYSLSGTLTSGTSTITVTYDGKTTTFNVNVTTWDSYNYSISNGQIVKVTGSTIVMSNYQNDIQLDSADSKRRSFPTTRGVRPFLDRRNGYADLGYYPIPIPDDAIGAVVTITPATQYHGAAFYTYTNSGGYVKLEGLGLGWEQGSKNYVFANLSSEDIKFITVAGKYDSSGGTYSEEPSELTVEFYKE